MVPRVGSRGSTLARKQADLVIGLLKRATGIDEVNLRAFTTLGDRSQANATAPLDATGVFVREIEEALLDGEIDLAVHSLKDLPTKLTQGLVIASVLERGDPRDALISPTGGFDSLPRGAVVGTSSPRRKAQILGFRNDLRVKPLRGNVDTRLKRLEGGDYDAIVLAASGLDRLGLGHKIAERVSTQRLLPAACQGIIAIQTREEDEQALRLARLVGDEPTALLGQVEREFAAAVEGGCRAPVGCLARAAGATIVCEAMCASLDGSESVWRSAEGTKAGALGMARALARELLESGGRSILDSVGVRASL